MTASARTNPETIKDAFALYLKYNGGRFDLIEDEMRRIGWEGFSTKIFFDKGKGENFRMGWISRFGWENALKLHIATAGTAASTSAESLLFENETIRKEAFIEIQVQGVRASKEVVWQHNTYTQNCIKILDKLESARDNYGNFVFFLKWLVKWSPQISPALAEAICDAEEALIDRAEKEFISEEGEKPDDAA